MKIVKRGQVPIKAKDLQDGQIAIVVEAAVSSYVGRVVQRYENDLVALGKPSDNSWENASSLHKMMVEMLPKGTTLEI